MMVQMAYNDLQIGNDERHYAVVFTGSELMGYSWCFSRFLNTWALAVTEVLFGDEQAEAWIEDKLEKCANTEEV